MRERKTRNPDQAGVHPHRRLLLFAIAGFFAAVSLLFGLFEAQRAESAAGQVKISEVRNDKNVVNTKNFNLSSIQPDSNCDGAQSYSVKSLFEKANISTSVSNLKYVAVSSDPNASVKTFPDFVIPQPDIQSGNASCPLYFTMASNRTYFHWGNSSKNRVSSTDRLVLFTRTDLPVAISKKSNVSKSEDLKVGKRIYFEIPRMPANYKFRWKITDSQGKQVTASDKTATPGFSHEFKKAGTFRVEVKVTGAIDLYGWMNNLTIHDKNSDSKNKGSGGGTGGGNGGTGGGGGLNGNGSSGPGTGTTSPSYTPPSTTYSPPSTTTPPPPTPDPIVPDPEPEPEPEPVEEETPETFDDPSLVTVSGIPIATTGAFLPGGDSGGGNDPMFVDSVPDPAVVETPMILDDEDGFIIPPAAWFALATILLLALGAATELGYIRFGWLREQWLNLRYKLGV